MKINKYIKIKGESFPLVSTPISGAERIYLEENFDRYFIYDVNNGTIKNNRSVREFKRYKVDFGIKPILSIFACLAFSKSDFFSADSAMTNSSFSFL